jgi:hypothetical protein
MHRSISHAVYTDTVIYHGAILGIGLQAGAESWHQLQLIRIAGEARRAAALDQPVPRDATTPGAGLSAVPGKKSD